MTREPADAHATVLEQMAANIDEGEPIAFGVLPGLSIPQRQRGIHEACVAGAAALRAREDAGRADGTREALETKVVQVLDRCGLGRGVTLSSIQRFYRVNAGDAMKLQEVRAACFDALDAALAASPAPAPTTEKTCATCRKASRAPEMGGRKYVQCRRFDTLMAPSDGCRNGWEPRGPNQKSLAPPTTRRNR